MGLVPAVMPIIIIVVIFFFVVRVATVILKLTGMDEGTARFQAISAFTGTGFTTTAAETILEDRVRKKTVVVLMVLGKVGIVSVIAGLFLSFGKSNLTADLWKAIILLAFFAILYRITTLKGFSRALNRFIEKRIVARGIIRQKTLEELFHLPKGYGLAQLTIGKATPLGAAGKKQESPFTLAEAGLNRKDILVLSIERKEHLIAFPHAGDVIKKGDKLLCYGLIANIKEYA
ncbi:MAG: TrkA C-terminal domain-containing protein [Candidatus Omnitrophica bacterium]|nr:TrkA C-terminal domain-containing protein [Candidatus Omnitrophota bacterium]